MHQKTIPFTPEQNGSAEHENRIIIHLARISLQAGKLPIKMWAEVVNYIVYILNRTEHFESQNVRRRNVFYIFPKEKRRK